MLFSLVQVKRYLSNLTCPACCDMFCSIGVQIKFLIYEWYSILHDDGLEKSAVSKVLAWSSQGAGCGAPAPTYKLVWWCVCSLSMGIYRQAHSLHPLATESVSSRLSEDNVSKAKVGSN